MTDDVEPRRYRSEDAGEVTTLLNRAYRELQEAGLNFTAATQDIATTRRRVAEGVCWVVEHQGRVSATMTMSVPPPDDIRSLSEHAQQSDTGWLCQVAVGPELRGRAVAKTLFDAACAWAISHGITRIGLDTAASAEHLIAMYTRWGFAHVDDIHFPGKNYDSAVMTRDLPSE
ncbi:GNAT family N-acetyltransferase [Curtobacterium sp. MCSS17_016]|uniref:GNAT family N-acetyltransferase n=1 Tax=Curtobacterium sp. MCSS17_016 TaxID=2175644 RepID=UPI000DA8CD89|nr:GNAT family N-acetyltransferase [Curtobacterium sp. MCSS17_016]WIE80210.1 GNAT family N-acetyltransferase [Curtobacterium sp. MCSS17_016]